MKSKIFLIPLVGIFALILTVGLASAATLAEWSLTSDGSPSNVALGVNAGVFAGGPGISVITFSSDGARASSWSTGAVNSNDYFQISLTANSGKSVNINTINLGERRSDAGIRDYTVQW